MKKINIFRFSIIVFVSVMTISAVTYAKITQSNIANSVLRLHVVANSNQDCDQSLKLAVRDRILREATALFENTLSAEDAVQAAKNNLAFIQKIAEEEVKQQGYDYSVTAEVGKFPFPVKFYDDIMLPSGQYTAVKITIGKGKGRNWWCVMYPPMCSLEGITMDTGRKTLEKSLSREEYSMISSKNKKAEIRFKIVDMINSIL